MSEDSKIIARAMKKRKLRQAKNDLLCIICQSKTNEVFNINFKATAICRSCANTITLQQVKAIIKDMADEARKTG